MLDSFQVFFTWLNDESCTIVIENAWNTSTSGSHAFQLVKKLQYTRKLLSIWNREHFGNINHKVDNLQQQLNHLQSLPYNDECHNKILFINKELDKCHKMKSELYQQKSRDHFIKDMNYNNKYFHTKTNRKKARNNIDSIQDHNSTWIHTRDEISIHFIEHFKSISISINPLLEEGLFINIPTIITDVDNVFSTRLPSSQDIFDILKTMENWSAPGPDGFKAGFYKSQ